MASRIARLRPPLCKASIEEGKHIRRVGRIDERGRRWAAEGTEGSKPPHGRTLLRI